MQKEFNIIIAGVGGQGIITLLQIVSEAAFLEGFEIKTSELHGLSQRGGSVSCHIRFGKKIFSPLITSAYMDRPGKADLIIGLEISEGLRNVSFANKKTIFLIDKKFIPFINCPSEKEIIENLKKITANLHLIEASKICQEKLQKEVVAGIYLLSYAVSKKIIPLKQNSILKGIKKIIPEKFQSINLQTFKLGNVV